MEEIYHKHHVNSQCESERVISMNFFFVRKYNFWNFWCSLGLSILANLMQKRIHIFCAAVLLLFIYLLILSFVINLRELKDALPFYFYLLLLFHKGKKMPVILVFNTNFSQVLPLPQYTTYSQDCPALYVGHTILLLFV